MSFRYVEEANGLSGLDRPPILAIAIGGGCRPCRQQWLARTLGCQADSASETWYGLTLLSIESCGAMTSCS